MATFPNTESTILRGTDNTEGRTSTGLSTQIIIKVNNQPVGALQNLKTLLVAVELDSSTARPAFWHKILTW